MRETGERQQVVRDRRKVRRETGGESAGCERDRRETAGCERDRIEAAGCERDSGV